MPWTACPKQRPALIDKRERKARVASQDRAENVKVKQRSQGCCEMTETWLVGDVVLSLRCGRRAVAIHHLRSGIGMRNRGESITAPAKLHVCDRCHEEIHGHVLTPMNDQDRYDATTVTYERRT